MIDKTIGTTLLLFGLEVQYLGRCLNSTKSNMTILLRENKNTTKTTPKIFGVRAAFFFVIILLTQKRALKMEHRKGTSMVQIE